MLKLIYILGYREDIHTLFASLLSSLMTIIGILVVFIFYSKRLKIVELQRQLTLLENHFQSPDIYDVELRIRRITKIAYIIGIIGGEFYVLGPFLSKKHCELERMGINSTFYQDHWPCGIYAPFWFPFSFNKSPIFEIVIFVLVLNGLIYETLGYGCYSLEYALVEHTIRHLRNLRRNLAIVISSRDERTFIKCIEYHIDIIK